MSLYNMVHGINPFAGMLMQMLGGPDVPRFRDCYLDDKGRIVIYTRTGGGNRDFYESEENCRDHYPDYFEEDEPPTGPWNCDLRKIDGFLYDEDDDYDSTYALFYFKVPADFAEMVKTLEAIGAKKLEKPADAWQRVIAEIQTGEMSPQTKRAMEAMKPAIEAIATAVSR